MSDEPLKRTALHETHKQLGAKMVPFGGYDMPVWYTSVLEEHNAVRGAAGLFDVSHMGVWDARGPNAALFLDAITTNDVLDIPVGGSQYSYLLDENGDVVDDIMLYRVERERYLIVVNASNNDKDWDWVCSWNTGTHAIKPPTCQLRDLRAESSDADPEDGCRVDIALQGPASLSILLNMMSDEGERASLQKLPRTGVMRASLLPFDVFIARTGYTGESIAYEIFVHPRRVVALWKAILAEGEQFGVKPCALAARDSLRTEAGLPLYGHELAGPLNLAPYHIGFGGYAKAYKPFFVGKAAYFSKAVQAKQKLSRFKFGKKGVRPPKQGTGVFDASGNPIGTVTSCAQDSEGLLLGLAMLNTSFGAKEGTPIYFASRPGVAMDDAMVLTRFPKRK